MNSLELRASLGLAGLYALRLFGIFLILPVFALHAGTLNGSNNTTWIGIALGSYGLTQAVLQLPFGILSDRIGRKKVIYIGLILFACGSFIAASAQSIEMLTLGRTIQGAGAISAAITALLADLTREENRTRAMAMIGASIGITFALSLILGPLLAHWIGVSGIFLLTGLLALIGLLSVKYFIPDPIVSRFHSDAETDTRRLINVIRHAQLWRLNFGIFVLHSAQMAMFVVIPFVLISTGQLDKAQHWKIYLPTVLLGFLFMVPAVLYGETRYRLKHVFISAIALMTATQFGMAFTLNTLWDTVIWLTTYFLAFNVLEACLPSLISKIAPAATKGTAMGVYNTAQSLGLFLGAVIGGWLYTHFGKLGVFSFTGGMMLCWLWIATTMDTPAAVKSKMFAIGQHWQGDPLVLSRRLAAVAGVSEAIVIIDERVAYLKVAQQDWDEASVKQLIQETHNGIR